MFALIGAAPVHARPAHAQGWALDVYAGGVRTGALAALPSSNLVGNIRWSRLGGRSAYATLGAPLGDEATTWGAAGASDRWNVASRAALRFGIDVAADGYAYRASDLDGAGATLHALPFLTWTGGIGSLELRAGRREHFFRSAGESDSRGVWEASARMRAAAGPAVAVTEARWLHAPETDYPFLGLQLFANHPLGRVWAGAGTWLADSLEDAGWSAGASLDVGRFGELWAAYRDDPADPLYRSAPRRSWTVGISVPLGPRPAAPSPELAPLIEAGRVRIRLPIEIVAGLARAGRATAGNDGAPPVPAVAGEFSDWKLVPMQRAGEDWVVDLELASGVYRFAFVFAGEWFVPEGYPGRMRDDMGGHVALLIVP